MRMIFEDGGPGGGDRGGPGGGDPPPPASTTFHRPLGRSLGRGARGRCPACGTGPLFAGWLAVARECRVCGEELHHHRADDLPPYLTIFVVGHVVIAGLLLTERSFQPPVAVAMAIWLPTTVVLALALLRPIKGAVVALQWAFAMHGFARAARRSPSTPETPPCDPPPTS